MKVQIVCIVYMYVSLMSEVSTHKQIVFSEQEYGHFYVLFKFLVFS